MILTGSSGAAAALPFSLVNTTTGAGKLAHAWVDAGAGLTAEFKVRLAGGAYANATISRIIEIGGGNYEYQLTAGESATAGKVYYYPNVAGHDGDLLAVRWEDVVVAAAAPTAIEVRDAILNYSHDTGLTIKGAFRRMDAVLAGKATGLLGLVARYYRRDGITVAVQADQVPTLGTRQTTNVTGSES